MNYNNVLPVIKGQFGGQPDLIDAQSLYGILMELNDQLIMGYKNSKVINLENELEKIILALKDYYKYRWIEEGNMRTMTKPTKNLSNERLFMVSSYAYYVYSFQLFILAKFKNSVDMAVNALEFSPRENNDLINKCNEIIKKSKDLGDLKSPTHSAEYFKADDLGEVVNNIFNELDNY
ncbi:MAG: hypothetical protein ACQEQF_05880 [Bacillota bacterium]